MGNRLILALLVGDFRAYWCHRWSHQWPIHLTWYLPVFTVSLPCAYWAWLSPWQFQQI